MSIEKVVPVISEIEQHPCKDIELIIHPVEKNLGEFSVRRVLPSPKHPIVGPWIFFDHAGPVMFPPGEGINVRPHPHINLATVTYLFEGEIFHRDSLGNVQAILPGDINLMVAGSGIVHSERERPEIKKKSRSTHGLQLWMALPEKDEEIDPAFYHYSSSELPSVTIDQVPIRVMMGTAYGVTSPVKTFSETLYAEAHLQAGQRIIIPEAQERAVYACQGEFQIDGKIVPEHSMAILTCNPKIALEATKETQIALIGGEHLGKRHIYWNFASSRKERIEQAKQDWKDKKFPVIPGDEEEFIPLPE